MYANRLRRRRRSMSRRVKRLGGMYGRKFTRGIKVRSAFKVARGAASRSLNSIRGRIARKIAGFTVRNFFRR